MMCNRAAVSIAACLLLHGRHTEIYIYASQQIAKSIGEEDAHPGWQCS